MDLSDSSLKRIEKLVLEHNKLDKWPRVYQAGFPRYPVRPPGKFRTSVRLHLSRPTEFSGLPSKLADHSLFVDADHAILLARLAPTKSAHALKTMGGSSTLKKSAEQMWGRVIYCSHGEN